MINKKAEWKRVLIFFILSYALTWIPAIIMNTVVGYENYFTSNRYLLFNMYLMLTPAIANVLTRLITREGWKESFLHLNLQKNVKPYLFAVFFPPVCSIIGGMLISIFFGKLDFGESFERYSPVFMLGISLTAISAAVPQAFYCFGEEFGWRAYLYPKLEKLLGTPAAIILGGIIWGVWHAPLTVEGHNFGTDYPGYPWLGILTMCLFCITVGAVLMWLTKRTGSVYPAAIAHASINGANLNALFANGYPEDLNGVQIFIPAMLPALAVGVFAFVLLCKRGGEIPAE